MCGGVVPIERQEFVVLGTSPREALGRLAMLSRIRDVLGFFKDVPGHDAEVARLIGNLEVPCGTYDRLVGPAHRDFEGLVHFFTSTRIAFFEQTPVSGSRS